MAVEIQVLPRHSHASDRSYGKRINSSASPQRLQRELNDLQQKLAARDREVSSLKEIAAAATELQAQDLQAAKVIELSRKVDPLFSMPLSSFFNYS
jgi:hypothetical protein